MAIWMNSNPFVIAHATAGQQSRVLRLTAVGALLNHPLLR